MLRVFVASCATTDSYRLLFGNRPKPVQHGTKRRGRGKNEEEEEEEEEEKGATRLSGPGPGNDSGAAGGESDD